MQDNHQDVTENPAERQRFYLDHLSKIDCVYSHLAERISELTGNELFKELKNPIQELTIRAKSQLKLLEHIYDLLGQKPNYTQCNGLVQFLEENFSFIQPLHVANMLRRLHVLCYLQYTHSIITTSFQLLQQLDTENVFNAEVYQQIDNLQLRAQKENAILTVLI